jgi:hypothetical protein
MREIQEHIRNIKYFHQERDIENYSGLEEALQLPEFSELKLTYENYKQAKLSLGCAIKYLDRTSCSHDNYVTREFFINSPKLKKQIPAGENNVVTRCEDCWEDISNLDLVKTLEKHNCCSGECYHDDCCGKIPENCPLYFK